MTKKILLPILIALTIAMSIMGILSIDSVWVKASTEKTYLVNSKELAYFEDGLWKTDEFGSGYVAKWDGTVISPSGTGAIAIVFTAPDTATLSGIVLSAYNSHPIIEENNNDGSRIAVFKNNQKIYPAGDSLFAEISNDDTQPTVINDIADMNLVSGDKLYFIAENGGNGNNGWDSVIYDFTCTYQDTVTSATTISLTQSATYKTDSEADKNASSGIGDYTKAELISYEYVEILSSVDMEEVAENDTEIVLIDKANLYWSSIHGEKYWCAQEEDINPYNGTPYYHHAANGENLIPGNFFAIAIEFTAPTDGRISNQFGLGSFRKSHERGLSNSTDSDLARFSVVRGNKVIYPSENIWAEVPYFDQEYKNIEFNSFDIEAGEKLYYVVENGGNVNNSFDNVMLKDVGFLWIDENNPNGVWFSIRENYYTDNLDEESTIKGFKKSEVLSYLSIASIEPPIPDAVEITKIDVQPIKDSLYEEMDFDSWHTQLSIRSAPNLLVRADCCQPSELYMLALQWTAPADGRLRVSSSYINNFNYKTEDQIKDGSISDGVRIKMVLNDTKQIFPTGEKEWETTNANENLYINVDTFAVEAGDTVLVILDANKKEAYDTSILKLVYDFAETGSGFTARYDSYVDTAEMFATPNGTLEDTPWEYFAITIERDVDRYFGGNTYEPPIVPAVLAGCAGSITGGNALIISACVVVFAVFLIVRRRRLER